MRIFLAVLLAALTGVVGWYIGSNSKTQTAATNIESEAVSIARAETRIRGLGKLEPASGIVKILAPQGQKIETLFDLKVGDPVTFAQPIVQFSGRKARELELKIAKSRKQDALNQLELEVSKGELKKSSAQIAIDMAKTMGETIADKAEQISLLRSQKSAAENQLQQLLKIDRNPLTSNMVGQNDLVKQQLLVDQINTKIANAEIESKQASQQANGSQAAAENDLRTVELMIDQADKSVPLATLDATIKAAEVALELTEIKAPFDGTVLDIVVRPGDSVTNQPVMVIGDTNNMVCVCEINDVNFRYVTVGDKATISSIALADDLTGEVISKGIMIGPPSMKDPNPFASVDRKTGRVVVALDDSEAAREFINLQVDVEIEIDDSADNLN